MFAICNVSDIIIRYIFRNNVEEEESYVKMRIRVNEGAGSVNLARVKFSVSS